MLDPTGLEGIGLRGVEQFRMVVCRADLTFIGTPTELKPFVHENQVWTDIQFDVHYQLTGTLEQPLRRLGGQAGRTVGEDDAGPNPRAGQPVLVAANRTQADQIAWVHADAPMLVNAWRPVKLRSPAPPETEAIAAFETLCAPVAR